MTVGMKGRKNEKIQGSFCGHGINGIIFLFRL